MSALKVAEPMPMETVCIGVEIAHAAASLASLTMLAWATWEYCFRHGDGGEARPVELVLWYNSEADNPGSVDCLCASLEFAPDAQLDAMSELIYEAKVRAERQGSGPATATAD